MGRTWCPRTCFGGKANSMPRNIGLRSASQENRSAVRHILRSEKIPVQNEAQSSLPVGPIRIDEDKISIEWVNTIVRTNTGTIRGGGSHKPHQSPEGASKKPLVSFERSVGQPGWDVKKVTCFSVTEVREPHPGAYPVVGTNVWDNPDLGCRKPVDAPEGKGYWPTVIENMDLYDYTPDGDAVVNKLQWWVEGSTEYHELVHHRLYRQWFKAKLPLFLRQMAGDLQSSEDEGIFRSENSSAMKRKAGFSLDFFIGMVTPPDTEEQAYKETRGEKWQGKIREIQTQASALKWVDPKAQH